jgi:putative inorganic carbon (hco3(-)) transporter
MREMFLLGFLAAFLFAGFRRPFIFVLAYAYVDIVSPQQMTYLLMNKLSVSVVCFGLAVMSWVLIEDKKRARFAPRQGLMVLLFIYCMITTQSADFPLEAAMKWEWVWKALIFAIFLPLTLTTRLRIEALAVIMTLSIAAIIINGGIKTLGSGGGGYGQLKLLVHADYGLYETSTIAMVAISVIPIILYLKNNGTIFRPDWRVSLFCIALVFACLLIPIGTQARTGLVCAALLAVLALRHVKRPLLYIVGAVSMVAVTIPFLPQSFTDRMSTLQNTEGDQSASTRVQVWKWTWDYVQDHPTGGGFNAFLQNIIRYETQEKKSDGTSSEIVRKQVEDKGRAYHSSYFEMLGEQGFPGLIIWLAIHFIGLWRMEMLYRTYRKEPEDGNLWIARLAIALQQSHIVYLLGSLFVGIAFQPFVYMLVGMQIGLDVYAKRREEEALWRPVGKNKEPVFVEA